MGHGILAPLKKLDCHLFKHLRLHLWLWAWPPHVVPQGVDAVLRVGRPPVVDATRADAVYPRNLLHSQPAILGRSPVGLDKPYDEDPDVEYVIPPRVHRLLDALCRPVLVPVAVEQIPLWGAAGLDG